MKKWARSLCICDSVKPGPPTLSADDVKAFCQDKITHFKIPRYIDFVAEYPMTVMGKIQKFVMRDAMTTERTRGGAIYVRIQRENPETPREDVLKGAEEIYDTMTQVLNESERRQQPPHRVANQIADERLQEAKRGETVYA